MKASAWRWLFVAVVAVGLAVRLASVILRAHAAPAGDPLEYWGQSNLLAEGKGWIEPLVYSATGTKAQTAKLPPLYTMLQALCSLVGFKSFFSHRIWTAVLSSIGVIFAVLLGRDLVGRRVGLLAGLAVAVYPNIWMPVTLGMSESISPVMVLIVLWLAYRMWRRPTIALAGWLGLAIGLAALARDEMLVFAVLILLPLAVGSWGRPRSERIRLGAAGLAGVIVIVVPWVTFNMIRFQHPVFISDRFGVTLASANCDATWKGPLVGYWSEPCAIASVRGVTGDESAAQGPAERRGLDYIRQHLSGLPAIEAQRLGRTFALYDPIQQVNLDVDVEARPRVWAFVGLWSWYVLAVLSVAGALVMRRRGLPLFPIVAVLADVVVVVLITYGQTRFRATLEPVVALLAVIALEDGVRRLTAARRRWQAPPTSEAPFDPTSAAGRVRAPLAAGDGGSGPG